MCDGAEGPKRHSGTRLCPSPAHLDGIHAQPVDAVRVEVVGPHRETPPCRTHGEGAHATHHVAQDLAGLHRRRNGMPSALLSAAMG